MSDPKELAKEARRYPETEKLLRQFLRLESGGYSSNAFKRGMDFHSWTQEEQEKFLKFKEENNLALDVAFSMYLSQKESNQE